MRSTNRPRKKCTGADIYLSFILGKATIKPSNKGEKSSQNSNYLTNIFKCPKDKCVFQTKQKHCLDKHVQHHTDCGVCGKTFQGRNRNRSLVNHLKTHQDKPAVEKAKRVFRCDFCNKDYKSKQSMQIHMRQNCNTHLQNVKSELCKRN